MDRTSEPRTPVFGPPTIGGHVIGPVIVTRTTGAVVVLRQVLAYPNGIEIDVEAHAQNQRSRPSTETPCSGCMKTGPASQSASPTAERPAKTTTSPLGTEMTGQSSSRCSPARAKADRPEMRTSTQACGSGCRSNLDRRKGRSNHVLLAAGGDRTGRRSVNGHDILAAAQRASRSTQRPSFELRCPRFDANVWGGSGAYTHR
jgi:hypothetical protein